MFTHFGKNSLQSKSFHFAIINISAEQFSQIFAILSIIVHGPLTQSLDIEKKSKHNDKFIQGS